MQHLEQLLVSVHRHFADRSPELQHWPNPHPDDGPAEDEYSRVTDPHKWRILGTRADAWVAALVDAGAATVEAVSPADIEWADGPGTTVTAAVRVLPTRAGAQPLIVGRSALEDDPEAGITLGWGSPPVTAGWFPHCGCDACDGGSEPELETLDNRLSSIVTGQYRHLTRGDNLIVAEADGWRASGRRVPDHVESILANPTGWTDRTGGTWLG